VLLLLLMMMMMIMMMKAVMMLNGFYCKSIDRYVVLRQKPHPYAASSVIC